jgi:hypothetical protein
MPHLNPPLEAFAAALDPWVQCKSVHRLLFLFVVADLLRLGQSYNPQQRVRKQKQWQLRQRMWIFSYRSPLIQNDFKTILENRLFYTIRMHTLFQVESARSQVGDGLSKN